MKALKQLDNATLSALKTSLDGYQRFEGSHPQVATYFGKVIESLIGSVTEINVWAIRDLLNAEDDRRSRITSVRVANSDTHTLLKRLGQQELRVLRLIGEGYQTEPIADLLAISYRTVANHKASIVSKLELGSAKDLVKFAINNLTFS